ncbi:hypothetical protein MPSEU_000644200 [Mayamaea pseudoterrestris]|nr:hypothetical protein MPSEU_000644200 [Mayamaea pseudoterrestris]
MLNSQRKRRGLLVVTVLLSFDVLQGLPMAVQRQLCHGTRLYSSRRPQFFDQSETESSARAALERTAAQLQRLQKKPPHLEPDDPQDPLRVERETLYAEYIQQSANTLKQMLKQHRLSDKGRKPDLAHRLVAHEMQQKYGDNADSKEPAAYYYEQDKIGDGRDEDNAASSLIVMPPTFAGIELSAAAHTALQKAGFARPTPIQQAAIPSLSKGESLVIHAQTGSGKTIAYLLPMTEYLWKTTQRSNNPKQQLQRFIVLLPTRELAAQVAGVAMELAPPGSVRLVTHPSNLVRPTSQQQQDGTVETTGTLPRLIIASAKTFMISLYGDDKMPAPPTSKPEAVDFLRSIRVCVLDEVDRLLGIGGSAGGTKLKPSNKQHEKPAAIVAAAVARHTLGRAQFVAASATVGRPMKREFARVLGLLPQDCPRIVRSLDNDAFNDNADDEVRTLRATPMNEHVGRAVTMPATVKHYSVIAAGPSDGELLTCASKAIRSLQEQTKPCRVLLVLSRGFGISTANTIGALKHFRCKPSPISLLDALEAENTSDLIEKHKAVSQAAGVGQASAFASKNSYLLVTGEDTVRGIHLDGLDVVIALGRPKGPDEYCHIAGRTGRAGRSGSVINVVSQENAAALSSWETMLDCKFTTLDGEKAAEVLDEQ